MLYRLNAALITKKSPIKIKSEPIDRNIVCANISSLFRNIRFCFIFISRPFDSYSRHLQNKVSEFDIPLGNLKISS